MAQQSLISHHEAEHAQPMPYFFAPSQRKMIAMSIATFSIYSLWWFYANWRIIRVRSGAGIMPFWRTLFSIFWAHAMFKQIDTAAAAAKVARPPSLAGLTIMYIVCCLASRLPDPWWLLGFLLIVPPVIANSSALAVNAVEAPGYANARFTLWNWVGIVLGVVLLALVILGLLLPPAPAVTV